MHLFIFYFFARWLQDHTKLAACLEQIVDTGVIWTSNRQALQVEAEVKRKTASGMQSFVFVPNVVRGKESLFVLVQTLHEAALGYFSEYIVFV